MRMEMKMANGAVRRQRKRSEQEEKSNKSQEQIILWGRSWGLVVDVVDEPMETIRWGRSPPLRN